MKKAQRKRSPYTPIIGLMLAIALGVVGWLIAPGVIDWLAATLPSFDVNALPLSISRPIFTAILVVVTLIVFALVAALLAPKDAQKASESKLEQERTALRRRQKAERVQARKGKGRGS